MYSIQSWDIGSLPLRIEEKTINEGARRTNSILPRLGFSDHPSKLFEEEVVNAFIDKVNSGLDHPNYPQLRDMNVMFLEMMRGNKKVEGKYYVHEELDLGQNRIIPEMLVLKQNMTKIRTVTGKNKINVKICVTGPYTLSSFFVNRNPDLFKQLGMFLSKIVSNSIFRTKKGEVSLLSVDEPLLGIIDDPLVDHGTRGREALAKGLEDIYRSATSKGIETCIHLHDTSNDVFWDITGLDIIETHVEDPLYELESTVKLLKEKEKKLKASVAITLFDKLIEKYLNQKNYVDIPEIIGKIWGKINSGTLNPGDFLEEEKVIEKRLRKLVKRFGVEKVPYAGPECGLIGYPGYEVAIDYLKRISRVIKNFK